MPKRDYYVRFHLYYSDYPYLTEVEVIVVKPSLMASSHRFMCDSFTQTDDKASLGDLATVI